MPAFLRRTALLLCLTACSMGLRAQDGLYVQLGYNQSFAALDSLNFVIGRYNETRTWLSKPMNEIHHPAGIAFNLGYAGEKWLFELAYAGRRQRVKAEGDPGGGTVQARHVRYGAATFELGLAYKIVRPVALGLSLDFGAVNLRTRTGIVPQVNTDLYQRVSTDVTLGNSVFVQVNVPLAERVSLGFRPYYHFNWVRADFARLNQAINPDTWISDPDFILGRTDNFGFRVTAGIWLK